jgi:hypothetical protein
MSWRGTEWESLMTDPEAYKTFISNEIKRYPHERGALHPLQHSIRTAPVAAKILATRKPRLLLCIGELNYDALDDAAAQSNSDLLEFFLKLVPDARLPDVFFVNLLIRRRDSPGFALALARGCIIHIHASIIMDAVHWRFWPALRHLLSEIEYQTVLQISSCDDAAFLQDLPRELPLSTSAKRYLLRFLVNLNSLDRLGAFLRAGVLAPCDAEDTLRRSFLAVYKFPIYLEEPRELHRDVRDYTMPEFLYLLVCTSRPISLCHLERSFREILAQSVLSGLLSKVDLATYRREIWAYCNVDEEIFFASYMCRLGSH